MSKKEILVPFDLAKAKAGAKLRDRDGYNCRLVCDNMNTSFGTKIVVVVTNYDNTEKLRVLYPNGQALKEEQCHDDVLIVEEIEEPDRWRDVNKCDVEGWTLTDTGQIVHSFACKDSICWATIFAKKKMARAAKAAAMISQIIANDKRFGGAITDEEWENNSVEKFVICRHKSQLRYWCVSEEDVPPFSWLAFHTEEQRDLFREENEDLIRQFFML